MIKVDEVLRSSGLDCRMLLTVHDELVFEVPKGQIDDAAALVKEQMEGAYPLEVKLQADLGWGSNWSEAAPAGH
jgi:DNA polymerase-1